MGNITKPSVQDIHRKLVAKITDPMVKAWVREDREGSFHKLITSYISDPGLWELARAAKISVEEIEEEIVTRVALAALKTALNVIKKV